MTTSLPKSGRIRKPPATRQKVTVIPIESRITILRHQRVILDTALAEIYGVPVKRLNQQINRNQERFPADFRFQLKGREYAILRLQFATSRKRHGGRTFSPTPSLNTARSWPRRY
jgi:hypothetical protein